MGDPRKIKSKYSRPAQPWQRERIDEERTLVREYGLKNKTEIYKARSKLKTFADLAKKLIAMRGEQAEKERQQLISRLTRLGLVKTGAQLDDVLGIQLKNILERRLQTFVFRKGFARSVNQARQFIVHEHIKVADDVVTAPGYHVPIADEAAISFVPASPFANAAHSERALPPMKIQPPKPKDDFRRGGQRRQPRREVRRVNK